MKTGPSNIYLRLLAGKVTPEKYVAVVQRAVDMEFRLERKERRVARALEARDVAREHRRGKPIAFSWPRWPWSNRV